MMRISFAILYFAFLIVLFTGIGSFSAEDVFDRGDDTYHQRVFGITMEIPNSWEIIDKGEISANGTYEIVIYPELSDDNELYMNFSPIKGLSLEEFANENLLELFSGDNYTLVDKEVGNLECLYASIQMSGFPNKEYPALTVLFSRAGDHYLKILFYSYDSHEFAKVNQIVETIVYDKKFKTHSFLMVQNHWRYGITNENKAVSDLYLLENDPENLVDAEKADGSETIIFDDFDYPARFPAGETTDDNGTRVQYYLEGRYHVDNRGKRLDVYIPDIDLDIHNMKIGVDIRFEGGHPMKGNGIIFRGSEKGFYLFDLSPDGFFALYYYDDSFETLLPKEFAKSAKPYEQNRIELVAINNELEFFINSKTVKKIKIEDKLGSGFAGLYVCAGSWASFDNYFIEVSE